MSTSVTNAYQNYDILTAGNFHILVSWDMTLCRMLRVD